MKARRIFVLLFMVICIFINGVCYAEDSIKVSIDGKQLNFDIAPILSNGRTLVPLRAIFEALGAKVDWDDNTKRISCSKAEIKITLQIDNKEATVNDKQIELDAPAVIYNGSTFVPARFIAESFNAQVNWRDSDKTVVILSKEYIANQIDYGTNALNNRYFRKENNKQYKVNVTIDPRIELISIVQYLAGYEEGTKAGGINPNDFEYKRNIKSYFLSYSNHKAVQMASNMKAKGFIYQSPPQLMLCLSNPPELSIEKEFDSDLIKYLGGEKNLNQFVVALRDFAAETKFMEFYNNNIGVYENLVSKTYQEMNALDNVCILENYFGLKKNSYNIVLVPLYNGGGYGVWSKLPNDDLDIYNILGTNLLREGVPYYGTSHSISSMTWHEFGHSIVNPLTNKYMDEVNKYSSLMNPIQTQMKGQAYGTWESCVNEHIIRAAVLRLIYKNYGESYYNSNLKSNKDNNFIYVEAICKKLEQYENQREKYKTFDDFYPQILELFKDLSISKTQ